MTLSLHLDAHLVMTGMNEEIIAMLGRLVR